MLSQAEKLLQQGQAKLALPLLTRFVDNQPSNSQGWFLLAIAFHQNKQLKEALNALGRVFAIDPGHLQAINVKAVVLCDLGRQKEALQVYREALQLAPEDTALLQNMAIVLEQTGELDTALRIYDQILNLHPAMANTLLNRGALLLTLRRHQEALENNRQLANLQPNWEHAHFNLGESLLALEQWKEALAAYTRALEIKPDITKAHFGKGIALSMLQRFDEAQLAFSVSQTLDPASYKSNLHNAALRTGGELHEFTPHIIYCLKQAQKLNDCNWSSWGKLTTEIESFITHPQTVKNLNERALLFNTFSLPLLPASRLTLACNISARISARVKNPYTHSLPNSNATRKKIKIGYISPDFRQHPVSTLSRRLYILHEREKFEVYAYSLYPDDGSAIRQDIEKSCDIFRELSSLNDQDAAAIIRRDEISILIDLSGYTRHARPEILALRPAPLQLSYLGFPHTSGADFIDYYLGDTVIIPPTAEQYFSEKIAHLPHSYYLFNNQQTIAQVELTRAQLGLPEHGFVFCCHNNNYKITPDIFDCWMRILQQVPGSVLWLLKSNLLAQHNLCREAELRGIAAQRLVFAEFVPNDVHLARSKLADLFLDTLHCNAHSTATEALWAGLPVLTHPGINMIARVAASLLTAIDLPELITDSVQQYEELAVHLATHPDELKTLRAKLERNKLTTPLFDTEQQVKNIEAVYLHIWQRYQAGLAPETFHINKA